MRAITPARMMTFFSSAGPWAQEAQSYRQRAQLTAQWSSCCVHGKHVAHLLEREIQNLQTQGTLKNMYSGVGDGQCLIRVFIYLAPKLSTFVPMPHFLLLGEATRATPWNLEVPKRSFLSQRKETLKLLFWELIWITHCQLLLPSSSERGNETLLP